jgi:hypothetical protein
LDFDNAILDIKILALSLRQVYPFLVLSIQFPSRTFFIEPERALVTALLQENAAAGLSKRGTRSKPVRGRRLSDHDGLEVENAGFSSVDLVLGQALKSAKKLRITSGITLFQPIWAPLGVG